MALADDVVALARSVLGDALLGAYLHGSAVLGGLRPTSDVDVFAVSARSLSTSERAELVDGLLEISGRRARRGPDRPVEVIVMVRTAWEYPPTCDFLYGEWLREDFEAGYLSPPVPIPDLTTLITMVLAGNAPLLGPPPGELLDPVPAADLRRAIVANLDELLSELGTDTRNILLTFARIWVTLATGQILAKDAAAAWALARLPVELRPVLAHARAIYLGESPETWAPELFEAVPACAAGMIARIRELAG